MHIIGLSGTNGSGKDTVAQMLAERHGFYNASATEMLKEELLRRGWPLDRQHKAKLSAEWRRQFGMAVIVDRAIAYYEQHKDQYNGVIVGSLRHPGEADRIHDLRGTMIWTDADPEVRYRRVSTNAAVRGRAAEDDKSFEQFLAEEASEMHPQGDEATLNGAAVKERADITLTNNGDDIEAFKDEAERVLGFA